MLPTPQDRDRSVEAATKIEADTYEQRLALAAAASSIPEELLRLARACASQALTSHPAIPDETDQSHTFSAILAALKNTDYSDPKQSP